MNSSFIEFEKKLNQLVSYINYLDSISGVFKYRFQEDDNHEIKNLIKDIQDNTSAFVTRKVLEYNSIVISLYGYFERYLENIIIEYLENISHFVPDGYSGAC